ncbi:hypothetical protein AcV5_004259 [Taiwanofungus camphoratus]|nr:hypothetical protein AcW2_001147 [Antrodia cinnamomea]KAI0936007.1 hypothetical protein AcV5_004259 [Antrodia cinnamomea]
MDVKRLARKSQRSREREADDIVCDCSDYGLGAGLKDVGRVSDARRCRTNVLKWAR